VLHNGASLSFHGADRGRDHWLTFRNDYEASKAEAERMVRAAPFPGAVTGGSWSA
jgi:hypothetical protein